MKPGDPGWGSVPAPVPKSGTGYTTVSGSDHIHDHGAQIAPPAGNAARRPAARKTKSRAVALALAKDGRRLDEHFVEDMIRAIVTTNWTQDDIDDEMAESAALALRENR